MTGTPSTLADSRATRPACAGAVGWALLFARLQFGDVVQYRGHACRIIEICRVSHYPAITLQWDAEEIRVGKRVTVRSQETITDLKCAMLLSPNHTEFRDAGGQSLASRTDEQPHSL